MCRQTHPYRSRRLVDIGVPPARRHADGTFAVRKNELNDFGHFGHALPALASGVRSIRERPGSEEDRTERGAKSVDVIARQATPFQSNEIEPLELGAIPPNKSVWNDVVRHPGHPTDKGIAANPTKLLNGSEAANIDA